MLRYASAAVIPDEESLIGNGGDTTCKGPCTLSGARGWGIPAAFPVPQHSPENCTPPRKRALASKRRVAARKYTLKLRSERRIQAYFLL